MRAIALLLALACAGCSSQRWDARTANVVVKEPTLLLPAVQAARWWAEATRGEVRLTFVTDCEVMRWCTTIRTAQTLPKQLGFCVNTGAYSAITVDETLTSDPPLVQVLAHEFGHSFGLQHVGADYDESTEIMRPTPADKTYSCMGPETEREYRAIYGSAAQFFEACGPAVMPDLAQILPH